MKKQIDMRKFYKPILKEIIRISVNVFIKFATNFVKVINIYNVRQKQRLFKHRITMGQTFMTSTKREGM